MMCELCDNQGHTLNPQTGVWERCVCITKEITQQQLGVFYTPNPVTSTTLDKLTQTDVLFESSLQTLRPHVARVLLDLTQEGKSVLTIDAYRLVEIFLEKDEEFDTSAPTVECDLLILLVGFGDPRNRYLPELMAQVLGRREVLRLPTWVVLGIDATSVGMKYGAELAGKLSGFKKVKVR